MLNNINVSITGGGTEERELMSNIITNALVKEGYSNVALVNTVGEPMVGSDVQSLADVLRKNHPDFLDRNVRVWSIPVLNENEPVPSVADSDKEATLSFAQEYADGYTVFHQYPPVAIAGDIDRVASDVAVVAAINAMDFSNED